MAERENAGLSRFWLQTTSPPLVCPSAAGKLRLMQRFSSWLDARQSLWLLLLAPVYLFPAAEGMRALLLPLLLGLPLLWLATGRSAFLPSRLNPTLLLLAVMTLVSALVSAPVFASLAVSLPKLAGVELGFAVYAFFTRYARQKGCYPAACAMFLWMGAAVALAGIFGTRWFSTKFLTFNAVTNLLPGVAFQLPGAPDGFHPNQVAGTLLWVLPLMAAWLWLKLGALSAGKGGLSALLALIGLAVTTGVFVLTQSRSAYLGLAAAGVCLAAWLLPSQWRRWYALGMALLLVLGGVWLVNGGWERLEAELAPLAAGQGAASAEAFSFNSLQARFTIWSRAWLAIQDFPLTGMGMNTWRYAVYAFYPMPGVQAADSLGHAHNEFLQAALDLGMPGMLAFAWLNLAAARILLRTVREAEVSPDGAERAERRLLALGLLGGLLAHFLFGLTDAVALGSKPGVIFWALLGLTAGLEDERQQH